jgi:tripartite-type tricarboxylate transporter receptor subunit TctC
MKSLVVAAALLPALDLPVSAQEDVAAFYRGKTLRIVVGVGVGSGYDINARLLARHISKHLPGNPNVIVRNQPGAGSLTMANQLFSQLGRQHKPRNPGHVCLSHRADHEPGRSADQGDDRRRAGRRLHPVRLSDAGAALFGVSAAS